MVPPLMGMAMAEIKIPKGAKVFELNGEPSAVTRWPVKAILFCGHNPCCQPLKKFWEISKADCNPPGRRKGGKLKPTTMEVSRVLAEECINPSFTSSSKALVLFSGN